MLPTPRLRLRADPAGLFSTVFRLTDTMTGARLTQVALARFGFHADFRLDGVHHEVLRDGWLPTAYRMRSSGGIDCSATRHSIFHRSLEVRRGDVSYRLRSVLFSRTYELSRAGRSVGTIRPNGLFTRGLTLEAPAEFPRELAIFLIILVVHLRRIRRRN